MSDYKATYPNESNAGTCELEFSVPDIDEQYQCNVPSAADILYLINPAEDHNETLDFYNIGTELLCLLSHKDSKNLTTAELEAILHSPSRFEAVLSYRNRLYESAIDRGVVYLKCPICQSSEQRLRLVELAILFGVTLMSPIEDDRKRLREPALSVEFELPAIASDDVPLDVHTPNIEFSTDSSHRLTGVEKTKARLRRVTQTEMQRGRTRFEVDEFNPPEGKEDWVYRLPGFRAILRLGLALTDKDDLCDEQKLLEVEQLTILDFLFLDAAYSLSFGQTADIQTTKQLICEQCKNINVPATGDDSGQREH